MPEALTSEELTARVANQIAYRAHKDHEADCPRCHMGWRCDQGIRLDNEARRAFNALNRLLGGSLGPMDPPRPPWGIVG